MYQAFKNFYIALKILASSLWTACKNNFSFRHVLCVQGILKLAFLYSMTVIYIILFYFEFPSGGPKKEGPPAIAIYGCIGRIGESLLKERVVIAAKKLGWRVIDVNFPEMLTTYSLTKFFFTSAASIVNLIYKPKFNLAVTHYVYVVPYGYNITYLNMPRESIFNINMRFQRSFKHLEEYDAYIDLYTLANGSNNILDAALKGIGRSQAPIIPLYLAENGADYIAPEKRDKALLIGSLWGCNRASHRMGHALKKLAENGDLIAYGIKEYIGFLGYGYKGSIEDYGANRDLNNSQALASLHKEAGVALIIHSLEHMVDGIPTNRIAEAINAGAIAISDDNSFVRKYFGDNVLYIDSVKPSDQIYSQIQTHLEWIRAHPQEAEIKARAAHDVLNREFSMESSLKKLMDIRK
jgi:hypothetical protein